VNKQAGVILANSGPLILEILADNAHPSARELYAALPAGLVIWAMTFDPGNGVPQLPLCFQAGSKLILRASPS
jgi:hypothetical protein